MLIGVISDTHDHKENILKAVKIMNEKEVGALIHCGDYCSPFVKRWFEQLNKNIIDHFFGVFGNNDGDHVYLRQNLGTICKLVENGYELIQEFEGKQIYASHRPKLKTIEALTKSGDFDIVLSGHTHSLVNKKHENGVLEVNPGECCGYLTGNATFAIIDSERLEAEIIYL